MRYKYILKWSLWSVLLLAQLTVGAQWQRMDSGTDLWLRGVDFVSPSTGIVVGYEGTILHTSDGGDSWQSRISGTELDLLGVQYASDEVIYVTGELGIVLKSIDSGLTWEIIKENGAVTHECYFLNEELGYIAGEGGQVFKTLDGGNSWSRLPVGISGKVAVHFVNDEIGYFVGLGNEDAILKTINGGFDFDQINPLGFEEYSSVYFTSASVGYVVSLGGQRIIKTINSGFTFQDALPFTGSRMYDITFFEENHGQAIGGFPDRSTIFRTEDAGASWIEEDSGVDDPLFDSKLITEDYGFAVGMNGTILRRGENLTSTKDIFSAGISLFPNPAISHINLQVESDDAVQFRIIDVLGRKLKEGNFVRTANVSVTDLTAGVYYVEFQNEKQKRLFKFEKL